MQLYLHLSQNNHPLDQSTAQHIFRKLLQFDGSTILLGEVGQMLVSSCTLVIIPNLTRRGAPYALVENVVTHADHQGRGYGTLMLNAATEHAWSCGCYKVMLMTGSREPATLAFYENAGFARTKTGFQKRR
ncbi:putative acetyltransferase [Falsiruegeria litorea R37]|uniref:Putative acetyltransferase n=2 Tax=Falsiruegeria litorea TaxID=1280831 RepID=A0A1Y5RFP6_9RHOB|nr:putative acetyltransferase [Falsiruegeria litorea R37]